MSKVIFRIEDIAYLLGTEDANKIRNMFITQVGRKVGIETIVSFNDLGIAFGYLV